MNKVSIIIPAKNDRYLGKTVDDIYKNATGDIEVIVVLDGPTDYPIPAKRKNLILIKNQISGGIRHAINDAVAKASGKYLFKTDAHCRFGRGFDEKLKMMCKDDWVVVPRRFGMDPRNKNPWKVQKNIWFDYYYLTCPWNNQEGILMNVFRWAERAEKRASIKVDETMAIHGSAWFIHKTYFQKDLGSLDTEKFGNWGEHQEIIFKTWLSGGRVMINKNTWYAHLQLASSKVDQGKKDVEIVESHKKITKFWIKNSWPGQIHDFDWLIDKFWPLPTQKNHNRRDKYVWPEDWKKYYANILS